MPFSHIINCSLLTGIGPSNFIMTKEVPIYKNGRCDDPYNYGLVSVLRSFSKILEKLNAN